MSKYLVTSGCSFTAHSVEPNIAWPNHITDWQVINCAEMASGNSLISRNLIATIPHYVDKNPTVAVMWSTLIVLNYFIIQNQIIMIKFIKICKVTGGSLNPTYW